MAKEGDETLTSTAERSEAPALLYDDVPSFKKLTITSADLSSISSQEEAPPAVSVVDNITENPVQSKDPYELTLLDLGDQTDELEDGAIEFLYKTMSMGDTIGLDKAIKAKLDDIKRLGIDYGCVFNKIMEYQTMYQEDPKSLIWVYWYKGDIVSYVAGPQNEQPVSDIAQKEQPVSDIAQKEQPVSEIAQKEQPN